MAIGKSKVTAMNLDRVIEVPTKSGEVLAICRFNGKQRDEFMSRLFDLRDKFKNEREAASVEETARRITPEQLNAMTGMQYLLISLSVVDGDALEKGKVVPLFNTPDEVSGVLEPGLVQEWADICNKINGLGEDAEKEEAAGFFGTRSDGTGSASPGSAEGPTYPG